MQTLAVVPASQPQPSTVRLLSEIDHGTARTAAGKAVHTELPADLEKLGAVLVAGARGGSRGENQDRTRTRRVTFFLEPNRKFVLGLGTYRNCQGTVLTVPPDSDTARPTRLEALLRSEYLPLASIRLRKAYRQFRLTCTREEFSRFVLEAASAEKRHSGAYEASREALLLTASPWTGPEAFDEGMTREVEPAFLYAVFDAIEAADSPGDNGTCHLSPHRVERALVNLRSQPVGLKMLRENLADRSAGWLRKFRDAALQSYEASKSIQDPDGRADRFRRLLTARMGESVPGEPQEFETESSEAVDLVWNEQPDRPKAIATNKATPSARSELRKKAAAELASSREYREWEAARQTSPVVTQVGTGQFMEFWAPLIQAVQKRLSEILAKYPFSSAVLGFRPA